MITGFFAQTAKKKHPIREEQVVITAHGVMGKQLNKQEDKTMKKTILIVLILGISSCVMIPIPALTEEVCTTVTIDGEQYTSCYEDTYDTIHHP